MATGANIEKHAGAPIMIHGQKHPITQQPRIIIKIKDPYLRQLCTDDQGKCDPTLLATIKVSDIDCDCKDKILYEKILGDPIDDNDAMVYRTCKHTAFAAAKRQMKSAPTPAADVAQQFVQYAEGIIDKEVGEYLDHFSYSEKDWINHLPAHKQKLILSVKKYMQGESDPLPRRKIKEYEDLSYEGIVKIELQGTDGKPRMVCSIPQRMKYVMGPVTWHLEEIFQDHLKGYCGGQNLTQMQDKINEYIKQGFTKVVEGDGSAFDNTQDVTLKELDRYIYSKVSGSIYHVSRDEFMKQSQLKNKTMKIVYMKNGKKKELLEYSIQGTVFSGDCDTTLMNTTRMAMYNRFVNDMAGLEFGVDYVCFAKGDDFTVMYKPYITDEFIHQAYYKYFLPASKTPDQVDDRQYGLGQVLKFLEIGGPEIIKFCSLRAWYTDASEQRIYLTRDPAKFTKLTKYSRKTKAYSDAKTALYLYEQAYALHKNYKGIPFFEQMKDVYLHKMSSILTHVFNAQTQEQQSIILAHERAKIKDPAQFLDVFCSDYLEDSKTNFLYDVGHRHFHYKIGVEYWESMKLMERVHTDILTEAESKYVNSQLEAEFSIEELKSLKAQSKVYASKNQQKKKGQKCQSKA